ncbi:MAG: PEP-CTERM sorting domain-containing protein [Phycisphaerales bacterium JB037]
MKKTLCIMVIAGFAGTAAAEEFQLYKIDRSELFNADGTPYIFPETPANGSTYDAHSLLGQQGTSSAFFQYSNTPTTNVVTFDGISEAGTTHTTNGATTAIAELAPNGSFDFSIAQFTTNGLDMWPSGFSGGGIPLTRATMFIGINDPLDLGVNNIVDFAQLTFFDAAGGVAAGPFNITSFLDIGDGTWDGFTGIGLGSGAGLGWSGWQVDLQVSPAPSSLALLGLGGLAAARRRR